MNMLVQAYQEILIGWTEKDISGIRTNKNTHDEMVALRHAVSICGKNGFRPAMSSSDRAVTLFKSRKPLLCACGISIWIT